MVYKLIQGIAFLAACTLAHAELNLTPIQSEYEVEGVKQKNIQFTDGPKRISYTPPRGWTYVGGSTKLSLYPPDKTQGEGWLEKLEVKEAPAFDEAGVKQLADSVINALPKGNTDAVIVNTESNPVLINNHKTVEITVTYKFYGQTQTRSVLFCNMDSFLLRMTFDGSKETFESLHRRLVGSLCSWSDV